MKESELKSNDLKLMQDHAQVVQCSVDEARALFDGLPETDELVPLSNALDEAQGAVYSGSAAKSYLVLIITE